MTTIKLTKEQKAIVDFCETHEGLVYDIEVDDQYGSYRIVRVTVSVDGLEWYEAKNSVILTAYYSATSSRPRQQARRLWLGITTHTTDEIKIGRSLCAVQNLWSYNTPAGEAQRKKADAIWQELYATAS